MNFLFLGDFQHIQDLVAMMGVQDQKLGSGRSTIGEEDLLEPLLPNVVIHWLDRTK